MDPAVLLWAPSALARARRLGEAAPKPVDEVARRSSGLRRKGLRFSGTGDLAGGTFAVDIAG